MKKILKWVGIAILVIIVLGVLTGGKNNTSKPSTSGTTTETAPKKETGVTMEKFTAIKEGMTYEEVVGILGSEGEVMSSNELAGIKTVMYKWNGAAVMSNMNATFQDGKMVSKAQFGLK